VKTPEEEASLAEEFKIDVEMVRSLARSVNSPSVEKAGMRPAPGSKGEDNLIATVYVFVHSTKMYSFCYLQAIWVEPNIKTPIA